MRHLRPSELTSLLNELQRQVALEQYNEQRNHWAFLAAVITNGCGAIAGMFSKKKHKEVSPDDFISKEFEKLMQQILGTKEQKKDKMYAKHIQDAKQKGLNGPW